MAELAEKLTAIQRELKAPKGQYNAFGKYKYRSCEDILEAVKPLLNGTPLTITDELMLIGDRYYVKATACFGGPQGICVTAYAREESEKKGMDASQITGAASSYARKYALNGLFLIDDTKDADATENHEEKKKETKPPQSSVPPPLQREQPNDVPDFSSQTETKVEPPPELPKTVTLSQKKVLSGLMDKDMITKAEQKEMFAFGMAGADSYEQAQKFIEQYPVVLKAWRESKATA